MLAAHLAVTAEQEGAGPAVLTDTDPQGPLSAWWNSREADTPALASASLAELATKPEGLAAAGFKLAVIDTPPAITAAIRDVVKLADRQADRAGRRRPVSAWGRGSGNRA